MKSKTHRNLFCTASISFFVLGFATTSAFGADRVWTGLGGDDNWSTASNWSGGILPVPDTDSLTFSGTTRQSNNANLAFAYYSGITFSNGGFTLNGPSNPGLRGNITSTGDNTINTYMYIAGGATRFINNSSGTLTLPAMDLQGATIQDNSSGTTIFGGSLFNTGHLRVFSEGQTVLGGDNSGYLGSIDVFRFARLTHANGLGGASTTVTLDRSYENAYVDLNGLNVSGVNLSFTAAENGASTSVARIRNTSGTAASFGGNIALNYTGGVDGNGDTTLSGVISGAGGLVKLGAGNLTLTGANSYSGHTTVSQGALLAAYSAPLSIGGGITIQTGAFFQENSSSNVAYNGAFDGGGRVRIFSPGQMVLGGDNSGFTGNIDVFRFAKLTHASGLGGASTTVTLDRSYENAYVDLNGLNVSGVNLSFTAAENGASTSVARLRNTSGTAASFGGNIALNYTGGVDGNGDTTLSGVISGAGGLVKEGIGTLCATTITMPP